MKLLKNSHSKIVLGFLTALIFIAFACNHKESNQSQNTIKTSKTEDQIFNIVENMPEFPGGEMALRTFIADSIRYPIEAQEKKIQGKVYISFVVNKTGKVINAKVVRGVDPSLDNEALRVVNSLPEWKPGRQHGKKVNVNYTVPILFQLN